MRAAGKQTWKVLLESECQGLETDSCLTCFALKQKLKNSKNMHKIVVYEAFKSKSLGPGSIVGRFFWFPVYKHFNGRQHTYKTCCVHITLVTQDISKKWANHLPETIIDRNQVVHPVWTVTAPFCAMQKINIERYLSGNCPSENERQVHGRQESVELYQMRSPKSPSDFKAHFFAIQTLRIIEYGKELYLNHGSSYSFGSN